ncbi:hypothetical protein [Leptospira adleri]|uniref:Uncharacterized protein n=1 Tax=Leptospira adleri TaxID=2023186 RepID=A0A2M9YRK4_9LEPT|nr:hypothetical protein [Leptospira adleri]PJZ54168.1 hypothetical protein CH380_06570 [Leptospira adleri]PJZ62652.1 hypothetical protein CH376_06630 [Leptospira adleri]
MSSYILGLGSQVKLRIFYRNESEHKLIFRLLFTIGSVNFLIFDSIVPTNQFLRKKIVSDLKSVLT